MGMEHIVQTSAGREPTWAALRDFLGSKGYPLQLRMINGELAFPDEEPPDDWRELRLSAQGGMITVRRESGRLLVITWGNADLALRQAWNVIAWALATLAQGSVQTGESSQTPEEFWKNADRPLLNAQ